jgi:hypothetical protein
MSIEPWRVGVTGHRHLADASAVGEAAEVVARAAAQRASGRGRPLCVVSSLAEGADRIVAEQFLAQALVPVTLEVVLPMAAREYERDFPDTVDDFRTLLARAGRIETVLPTTNRDLAYLAAGLRVLASCDELVAVWDGLPAGGRGGTAEIVAAARTAGVAVTVVPATRRPA